MKWIVFLLTSCLIACQSEPVAIKKKQKNSDISSFNSGSEDKSDEALVDWKIFIGESDKHPNLIFAEFAVKDSLMIGNYFLSGQSNLINLQGKINSIRDFQLTQLFTGDTIGIFNGHILDTNYSQLTGELTGIDSVQRNFTFSPFSLRDSAQRIQPTFLEFQRKKEFLDENDTPFLETETLQLTQFGKRDFVFHCSCIDGNGNLTTQTGKGFWQSPNNGFVINQNPQKITSFSLFEDSLVVYEDYIQKPEQLILRGTFYLSER